MTRDCSRTLLTDSVSEATTVTCSFALWDA
jgi:hypothetical protein